MCQTIAAMMENLINLLPDRAREYALLMRLHKPIGIHLLLWPTLWGLWFAAGGLPDAQVLMVFVAGVILMRSAGCVINDYADRKIDPHVARTQDRPIAAGRVSPKEALILFSVICLIALLLVLQLNGLAIAMSVPAAALAASYPFTKRFTHLPQAYLGIAFGWGIPMGYAAQTGSVPFMAWWLMAVVVLWAVVYDTFYAMVDRPDDLKIGVKSTAILFGRHDRLITGLLQMVIIAMLAAAGVWETLGWPYWVGLLAGSGLFVYQQILIRDREAQACFKAFLNNHWFGLVVLAGLIGACL